MKRATRPNHFSTLVFALITLAVSAGIPIPTVLAQEPPSSFVDRVEVRVVNVEVIVTDGEGNHVTDLTKEDFEVFEDGEPVVVTNFYAVAREGVAAGEAAVGSLAELPAAEPKEAPQQRPHLLVYVDNYNLRANHRDRVLDSLDGFLEDRSAAGDQVMVMTHGLGLEIVQPFTSDRGLISQALDKVRKTATHGERAGTRQNIAARQIAHALSDPLTAQQAPEMVRSQAAAERQDLLQSMQALRAGVRSLAGIEGRKSMVYVGGGLPLVPGGELSERFFGESGTGSGESALFDAVVREAHANRVAFYAFDASGKSGGSLTSERSDEIGGGTNRAAVDAMAKLNLQQPLVDMAAPTGGTAFLGSGNFEAAVERVAADLETFYSLGFRPRAPGDGSFHRIEVRVRRPGLEVRHRAGFLDKPERERVADRTLSALLTEVDENPLGIAVSFGEQEKKSRKAYLLPILVRVPLREVTLLPQGGNLEGRLLFSIAVQDEEGRISDVQQAPYPISFPEARLEEARGSDLGYQVQLEIRPGTQKVSVGVLDESSGVESFATEVVLVGKRKKRR